MHQVALLRGLLESAGDEIDASQHSFDKKWSVNNNFAMIGHLFDLDFAEPVSFGSFDAAELSKALGQCKLFRHIELDCERLQQQICLYVPIGFSKVVYATLLVDLIHTLKYGTVEKARFVVYQ